jgi:hypothetical protein
MSAVESDTSRRRSSAGYHDLQAGSAPAGGRLDRGARAGRGVSITFNGLKHELAGPRVVLGRSKEADIQVPDPNVSRRHAEVRQDGTAYTLVDLDSTNGIEVGGRRLKRLKLENGTRFTIGSTEMVFSREHRWVLVVGSARRDYAPCAQDRLPRAALSLHLAHRRWPHATSACRRSR